MAVIKTETTWFGGEKFIKRIKVDKNGEFSIKLPPEINDILDYDIVKADTQSQVLKLFREALIDYKNAKTTTRKVIIYEVKHNTDELNERDLHFESGVGLVVTARVYIEHKIRIKGEDKYNYKKLDFDSGENLPRGLGVINFYGHADEVHENAIDWTQERHDFFVMIYEAMTDLILKLNELKNPTALIDFIDSGVKLIEGGIS